MVTCGSTHPCSDHCELVIRNEWACGIRDREAYDSWCCSCRYLMCQVPRSNRIGFESPNNGAIEIAYLFIWVFLGIVVSLDTSMAVELSHCMGILGCGQPISIRIQ